MQIHPSRLSSDAASYRKPSLIFQFRVNGPSCVLCMVCLSHHNIYHTSIHFFLQLDHELLDGGDGFLIYINQDIPEHSSAPLNTLQFKARGKLAIRLLPPLSDLYQWASGSVCQARRRLWGALPGRERLGCGKMSTMISWPEFMRACWEKWIAVGLALYELSIKSLGVIFLICYSHTSLYPLLSPETSLQLKE